MATNLDIKNELLEAAMKAGGHKTKKATVEEALLEYVQKRTQTEILDLLGTIEYEEEYDYKAERKKDRKRNSR